MSGAFSEVKPSQIAMILLFIAPDEVLFCPLF